MPPPADIRNTQSEAESKRIARFLREVARSYEQYAVQSFGFGRLMSSDNLWSSQVLVDKELASRVLHLHHWASHLAWVSSFCSSLPSVADVAASESSQARTSNPSSDAKRPVASSRCQGRKS